MPAFLPMKKKGKSNATTFAQGNTATGVPPPSPQAIAQASPMAGGPQRAAPQRAPAAQRPAAPAAQIPPPMGAPAQRPTAPVPAQRAAQPAVGQLGAMPLQQLLAGQQPQVAPVGQLAAPAAQRRTPVLANIGLQQLMTGAGPQAMGPLQPGGPQTLGGGLPPGLGRVAGMLGAGAPAPGMGPRMPMPGAPLVGGIEPPGQAGIGALGESIGDMFAEHRSGLPQYDIPGMTTQEEAELGQMMHQMGIGTPYGPDPAEVEVNLSENESYWSDRYQQGLQNIQAQAGQDMYNLMEDLAASGMGTSGVAVLGIQAVHQAYADAQAQLELGLRIERAQMASDEAWKLYHATGDEKYRALAEERAQEAHDAAMEQQEYLAGQQVESDIEAEMGAFVTDATAAKADIEAQSPPSTEWNMYYGGWYDQAIAKVQANWPNMSPEQQQAAAQVMASIYSQMLARAGTVSGDMALNNIAMADAALEAWMTTGTMPGVIGFAQF